jgi:hypothetical protein|tara:strand:- start:283 stop:615 length:333 start_codon:yes stop_codon:yes gene_type:complete
MKKIIIGAGLIIFSLSALKAQTFKGGYGLVFNISDTLITISNRSLNETKFKVAKVGKVGVSKTYSIADNGAYSYQFVIIPVKKTKNIIKWTTKDSFTGEITKQIIVVNQK